MTITVIELQATRSAGGHCLRLFGSPLWGRHRDNTLKPLLLIMRKDIFGELALHTPSAV